MSSKRALRRRACGTKVRHTTAARAMKHLKGLRSHGGMNVYRCRFCRGYHVGHAPWLYDADGRRI